MEKEKYMDSSLTPRERAEDLLAKLSLEEKMAQVNCVLIPVGREKEAAAFCKYGMGEISTLEFRNFKTAGEAAEFQEADIVLGTKNRAALLPHILSYFSHKQRIVDIAPHEAGEKFEAMRVSSFHGRTRAFLKIEDGCNRFCSYCIIPYARGRVRSKPLSEIRAEVRSLAAHDYREVVLTGINLPAYGQDLGLHLCDAVEAACEEPEIRRVRLGSLEPEQLTEEVIARLQRQKKLCPQFHPSLQSGCDETLRRMNHHYTTAEYRQIVKNLRAAFPGCAITTDIMVGFAGETEEEFAQSLDFIQRCAFAAMHIFPYSRRPGTPAAAMPGQVLNAVKEERARRAGEIAAGMERDYLSRFAGQRVEVLFEEERDGLWRGHTARYSEVRVKSGENLHNRLCRVSVTGVGDGYLEGEILNLENR